MKHSSICSYTTSLVELPTKKKAFHNVSTRKRKDSSKKIIKTPFESRRIFNKVHANINFTELDEVCLDVGKVDLSFSARVRNDTCLSPPKPSRDKINELHEVSFRSVNGHFNPYSVHNNNRIDLEEMKTIRSCYVQLESLEQLQKTSLSGRAKRVPVKPVHYTEDEDWKGWQSKISLSEEHGCPKVEVVEGSKVSEVLVMSDDLADKECKRLEKRNTRILKQKKSEISVIDSWIDVNRNKISEEKKKELKKTLCEFFASPSELNCFLESVDISNNTHQNKVPQKESCSRRLSFSVGNNDLPTCSNGVVQRKGKSKVVKCSRKGSVEQFLGFSESAILSSKKYARNFLDYYEEIKCQKGMM